MQRLLEIVKIFYGTMAKFLVIVFFILFSFASLFVYYNSGFSESYYISQIPRIALIICLFIIFAILLKLAEHFALHKIKENTFNKPAFKALNFKVLWNGTETFMIGGFEDKFYRLTISSKGILEIRALIDGLDLIKDNTYAATTVKVNQKDLKNPNYIKNLLTQFSKDFNKQKENNVN